ncbi:hypothetical protein Ssi03_56980 [Sphaerisporangium siamense]|uniref:Uncharacterized protein n=1 Tax=Sphaerisporangium siamense TaxID=795645 RepID=A0A7W7D7H7_9ACTN|nr:hypothetical protein [Sphaerisporangium siamense]MBB4700293.1 hypothetical protein [Sphaerisporangium siamense]GII87708.1 hypothetical protein Ssi03_56980 [Sphaerisporangium siamense]
MNVDPAGDGTGHANGGAALPEVIRDHMWSLLSDRYRTNRRASHAPAEDEYLHDRSFWPAFTFEGVDYTVEDGKDRLLVTFHDTDLPDTTLGFRVDLDTAMAEWTRRVGGRIPREHPEMFAAELIWFMVCYIGVADLDGATGTPRSPHWINDGSEIFGKLRNNPNMDTFESHH